MKYLLLTILLLGSVQLSVCKGGHGGHGGGRGHSRGGGGNAPVPTWLIILLVVVAVSLVCCICYECLRENQEDNDSSHDEVRKYICYFLLTSFLCAPDIAILGRGGGVLT